MLERDEDYPDEAPGGISWEEWLQTHCVELNAMTTPQFIAWLDAKMAEYGGGKLIPPSAVIVQEFEVRLKERVRDIITDRILREAGLERQIDEALAEIERPTDAVLASGISEMFESEPEQEWREHVERVVAGILRDRTGDEEE